MSAEYHDKRIGPIVGMTGEEIDKLLEQQAVENALRRANELSRVSSGNVHQGVIGSDKYVIVNFSYKGEIGEPTIHSDSEQT